MSVTDGIAVWENYTQSGGKWFSHPPFTRAATLWHPCQPWGRASPGIIT